MQDKVSANTDNRIHIVLSIFNLGDEYLRHAGATILSVLSNTTSSITFHLLQIDKESAKNKTKSDINIKKLDSIAQKYDANISIHNVEIPEWFNYLQAMKTYHVGTLLRLFIPDCLANLSKVIYLDCDIIVNLDIKELWNVKITDYPLAACIDTNFPKNLGLKKISPKIKRTYDEMNSTKRYFNAGVLLLNLEYLRKKHDFSKETCDYLSSHPSALFTDQDALNYLFGQKYLQLDKKFNIFAHELTQINSSDCCIHFAAQSKPWIIYTNRYDNYYWHYLLQTPWAESYQCIVKYLRESPDYSQTQGFASLPTRKQIKITLNLTKIAIKILFSRIKTLISTIF